MLYMSRVWLKTCKVAVQRVPYAVHKCSLGMFISMYLSIVGLCRECKERLAHTFRRKAYGFPETEVNQSIFSFKRNNSTATTGVAATQRAGSSTHSQETGKSKQPASETPLLRTKASEDLVRCCPGSLPECFESLQQALTYAVCYTHRMSNSAALQTAAPAV